MISGGNATLFVADMERAIEFYTQVLGLELKFRAENFWAEVQAGDSLVIGLHPASESAAAPGTVGAIHIGLIASIPLEEVKVKLAEHDYHFSGEITDDGPGRFASMKDPDGNQLYFWEHNSSCME